VSLPLSFPAWLLITAVVLGDRPQSAGRILVAALSANLLANVLLVPEFGILASAWLTVATDACVATVATLLMGRRGVRLDWLRMSAAAVPVAALMGVIVLALRDLPLSVSIGVGALVYLGGLKLAGFPERLGVSGFGGILGTGAG
jgi:O-antigen/teichoic acid export membrane protein